MDKSNSTSLKGGRKQQYKFKGPGMKANFTNHRAQYQRQRRHLRLMAESFRCKNFKEVSITEPEKNPSIKNNIPAISQETDSLSVKNTAGEGEDFSEQKLKGTRIPEPKRLKLPHWTNPFCRKTHAMQGLVCLKLFTLFYTLMPTFPKSDYVFQMHSPDGANVKLKEIGVAGHETFKLSNIRSNSCAGNLSCGSVNTSKFQSKYSSPNPFSLSKNDHYMDGCSSSQLNMSRLRITQQIIWSMLRLIHSNNARISDSDQL